MKIELKKELPLILITSIPFLYLWFVWADLPQEVPMHWNSSGEVDRYGSKNELIMIPFILPVLVYALMLVVPFLDPKKQLQYMGNKFHTLKTALIVFMSLLATYIIYSSQSSELTNPNMITVIIGGLFLVLGNFFKTIKANYFVGIRTPWTLESEKVWKSTHILGGKLWFIGGALIILLSFVLPPSINFKVFLGITLLITLVPIIYSYLQFKKEVNTKSIS